MLSNATLLSDKTSENRNSFYNKMIKLVNHRENNNWPKENKILIIQAHLGSRVFISLFIPQ